MNQRLNQFTLKGGLANQSFGMNIELENKVLKADENERYAVFFSRALDSGSIDMTWNRLSVRILNSPYLTYIIRVKAANERNFFYKDSNIDAADFLQNPEIPPEEKFEFFSEKNGGIQFTNCDDVLLYRLEGRYLWISFEFFYESGSAPKVEDICAEFPMENFIQYLPEVYQESYDFTSRFLAIPGMEFTDLNDKIDEFADCLDLALTDEKNLPYFSTWLGAQEKISILQKDKIREFLRKAVYFSSIKGTPNCLKEVVEFLVDEKVSIVEYHNYTEFAKDDEEKLNFLKHALVDENTFGVILNEKCYDNGATKGQVELFIQCYKPASAKAVIIYEVKDADSEDKTKLSFELGFGTMPKAYLGEENISTIGSAVILE